MENIIIEDEIEYKKINNINALVLKINYPSIKIKSQSNYKTWLEIQKKERGDNGFVSFCRKCNVLFYFISENEENITKKNVVTTIVMEKYAIIVENYILKILFAV